MATRDCSRGNREAHWTAGVVGTAGEAAGTVGAVGTAGEAAGTVGAVGTAGEAAGTVGAVGYLIVLGIIGWIVGLFL